MVGMCGLRAAKRDRFIKHSNCRGRVACSKLASTVVATLLFAPRAPGMVPHTGRAIVRQDLDGYRRLSFRCSEDCRSRPCIRGHAGARRCQRQRLDVRECFRGSLVHVNLNQSVVNDLQRINYFATAHGQPRMELPIVAPVVQRDLRARSFLSHPLLE